jgi:ketosteroid isomerase-like protein
MAEADSEAVTDVDDHAEIQRVLAEYCHAADEFRFDDFEALFTPDAIVTALLAGKTYHGPTEIRGFLEKQPAEMQGLHVTVNPSVTVGGDEARVRADFFVLVTRGDSSVVGAWGRYRDRLVRRGDKWLFAERHVETQWRLKDVALVR